MGFVTRSGAQFRLDGSRFRFVGVNCYPLIQDDKTTAVLDDFFSRCKDDGIKVVRAWCFNQDSPATNTVGNFRYRNGSSLAFVESTFVSLDRVLDSARRYGIKLILPLVDNFQNNKEDYCRWSDAIHGTSYGTSTGWNFFDDANIRQWYKDFVDELVDRTNTINGYVYKNDDTIMAWELGNELRYAKDGDPDINTINSDNLAALGGSGGWADVMSTYIKSKDSNHLVGFGDIAHFWEYYSSGSDEDAVYNGSYYGTDYSITGALTNIDYCDYHLYVYNDSPTFTLRKYGVKLGYAGAGSAAGLTAQIDNFNKLARAAGKPVVIGEWGVDKRNTLNDKYTSYPKVAHHQKVLQDFFSRDGDGFLAWHYATLNILDDNNYNIKPEGVHTSGNANNNLNDDDTALRRLFRDYAYTTIGKRKPAVP